MTGVKKNILVTGRPGIGKTTAVLRAAGILKSLGYSVGGMVSREERVRGVRTGFIIEDLMTGARGYLAKAGPGPGPRVGKYHVILEDLESVGVAAIERAIEEADVVVIDEIGAMELYSEAFKRAVARALDSKRPVLATIHIRARTYPFTRSILSRADVQLYTVTLTNREGLPRVLASEVERALKSLQLRGGGDKTRGETL